MTKDIDKKIDKNSPFKLPPTDDFRLRKYYYLAEASGALVPLFVALFLYFFPNQFNWILYPKFSIPLLFGVFVVHSSLFGLHEIFKTKIFFNLARYFYVVMFTVFVIITGGMNSPFYFLFIFPLIVSAVYLDAGITKRIGYAVTFFVGIIILFFPEAFHDPALVIRHIILTGLFGLIAVMMYRIVIETLKQKYEKEETTRKFSELIELERLKNDFLSVAQHQLRTPLSGLKWALETLKGDGKSPQSTQNAQLIDEGITRANDAIGIVNEMLTVAGEDKTLLSLSYQKVDMVRLVRSIVSELSYVALAKSVSVSLNLPDRLEIEADFKKLKAGLINIIDNALKYSPKGKVSIALSYIPPILADSAKAKLVIVDSGIGIAPGDIPYVFDRLHRGKNAIAVEPNESGVGLYTAKKIFELHGGMITLNSSLGEGTTVTVVLPVAKPVEKVLNGKEV